MKQSPLQLFLQLFQYSSVAVLLPPLRDPRPPRRRPPPQRLRFVRPPALRAGGGVLLRVHVREQGRGGARRVAAGGGQGVRGEGEEDEEGAGGRGNAGQSRELKKKEI